MMGIHASLWISTVVLLLVLDREVDGYGEVFTRDTSLDNVLVTTGLLRSVQVSYPSACALECISTGIDCLSLTYSYYSSSCRLHNTRFIGNATQKTNGTVFFRLDKETACGKPPTILNSSIQYTGTKEGDKATYTCERGLNVGVCPLGDATIYCKADGKWDSTNFTCQVVEKCSDIQHCNSSYTDGEYFVYPNITDRQRVKVYCHDMSSTEPKEYITLYNDNRGVHNFSEMTGSGVCKWSDRKGDAVSVFKKIRIIITNMTVVRDDFTFAVVTFEEPKRDIPSYGMGIDCSSAWNTCPKLGYFRIDTNGTGLQVDPTLNWVGDGHDSYISNFDRNLGTIEGFCGGWCGWCAPEKPMQLLVDSRIDTYETETVIVPSF